MKNLHQPVLLKEVLSYLKISPGEAYLDATLGGGGHAQAIIKAGGKLYGIDVDPQALKIARSRLQKACPNGFWQLEQFNFAKLSKAAKKFGQSQFAGILFDLGFSSNQMEDMERGLSFKSKKSLDMRLDPRLKINATDLLKVLKKGELNVLFKKYGEEKRSLAIADRIVSARKKQPIETGQQLAKLVSEVYKNQKIRGKIHPATRVFQALRIAVNNELNNLETGLKKAVEHLKPNGRLVVISFHSLEDAIVKHFFKENKNLKILTKKPVSAKRSETNKNPRARSARLRAAQKI